VLDGADDVMLSGETSVGKYPVVVIQNMKKIIDAVEKTSDQIFFKEHIPTEKNHTYISDSICFNACVMARQVSAAAIVTMTNSGYTGFKISSHRPRANVFIFTDNPALINTMSLVWGVRGFYYNTYESTDATIKDIKAFLKREKLVQIDDLVINIASMPMTEKGRANMLKLSFVKD
jgi:pyruvate kinase